MSDVHRSDTYGITDTDETIGRLIQTAREQSQNVRDGFNRTGVRPGDKVVDVGCGPIGALLDLSDLVGPDGTVVGVDMDSASLQRARVILDREGRDKVRLVHANIDADWPDELISVGLFDAAYSRCFLHHQPDPASTLRRIASLVRPGGYIVAHDPLYVAPLRSEPHLPEIELAVQWLRKAFLKGGSSPDLAREFHSVCRRAGLSKVSQRVFCVADPRYAQAGIRVWQQILIAVRPAFLRHGVASESDIDGAIGRLADAEKWEFDAFYLPMWVELVAQVGPPDGRSPSDMSEDRPS